MPDWDPASAAYAQRHGRGCAAVVWTPLQRLAYLLPVLALGAALWHDAYATAIILSYAMAGVFVVALGLRLLAMVAALLHDPTLRAAPGVAGSDLPRYAVLVPLYREPEVISGLLASLAALDYPPELLDVQILLEPDDVATRSALDACVLPAFVRLTIAPGGGPRTKPRACNAGLAQVVGCRFLVVYDAEDRPEPDQLRKAVAAYATLPPAVVCLQCRLAHYNARQSLAAGWSAVEYLTWFRLYLPGLQSLGAPIPLGGTSNHFRLEALRGLDGWDPFNVTEDCDLGMRIARRGWRTAMLDSTTWEEAVTEPGAWVRQRSRWVKGYCQTWLVHSRTEGLIALGPWRALWLAATVGGTVAMHLANPFAWAVIALWLVVGWSIVDVTSAWSVAALGVTVALIAANALFLLANLYACLRAGRAELLAAAATMPLAWLLHSVAAWRAVGDLLLRPFHWLKTRHGLAVIDAGPALASAPAPAVAPRTVSAPARLPGRAVALAALGVVAVALTAVSVRTTAVIGRDVDRQFTDQLPTVALPVQLPLRFADAPATSLVTRLPGTGNPWTVVEDVSAPAATIDGLRPVLSTRTAMPGAVSLNSGTWRDASSYVAVALDVRLPADAPPWMTVTAHVRDEDGRWYDQTADQRVLPGEWTRVEFLLDREWRADGHRRAWCRDVRARLRELGFEIHGAQRWSGEIRVTNLRAITADILTPPRTLTLTAPAEATVMQRWELAATLDRSYGNPFDPDVVDLSCVFSLPDGREERVPAFWYQPYERSEVKGPDHELLAAVGAPGWRVRYRPRIPGAFRWQLALRDARGETRLDAGAFAAAPAQDRGYLRRDAAKPGLFRFDDGTPYWPIGQNLCQAVDLQKPFPYPFPTPPDLGTYTFDGYLARMGEAGMDWARLWMTPWSFGLEGKPGWPDFHGLGRYNLANAWRLDHVLDTAASHGVRIQLTVCHHSEFFRENCWETSAYNAVNGGCMANPYDFYGNPQVFSAYCKRLRYLVARWGDDPGITGWELFGEANLMPGYEPTQAADWHRRIARYVRSIDHGRHLFFTHCHNWQDGHQLWALPEVDIIQGNGYIRPPNHTTDHLVNFDRYLADVARHGKPVMVAEYGGRSERGAPDGDYLEAQLHSGLWASLVEPFAGAAMPWWWDFTEGAGLYPHFKALSRFNTGLDRIAHDYRAVRPAIRSTDPQLRAAGMQDATSGFYWIHHRRIFDQWRDLPTVAGASLLLSRLAPGSYQLSWWSTRDGTVIAQERRILTGDDLIPVPPVPGDLGLKLEWDEDVRSP